MTDTSTVDRLRRLYESGAITADEFMAARKRLEAEPNRPPRLRLLRRIAAAVVVFLVAGLLVMTNASLLTWITVGTLILIIALIVPRRPEDAGD